MIPAQAPDSSVRGFLQGEPPGQRRGQITPGQPLENYLQQLIAGVAHMEETLVRPRWQPQPPNLPDKTYTWCATGITQHRSLGYAGIVHHGRPRPGHDLLQRHEEFDVLVSFYGPEVEWYAQNLHDGFEIWQNRSLLRYVGMAYVGAGDAMRVPELIKQEWIDRIDKTLTFRRIIVRSYPVLNLLAARFTIKTPGIPEGYHVSLTAPDRFVEEAP